MSEQSRLNTNWPQIGIWLTACYLVAAAALLHFFGARPTSDAEIGELLSGVCAPLAFIWLIIATMMQSQELQLQRDELKRSRDAAQQQAAAATQNLGFIEEQTKLMALQVDKLKRAEADRVFDLKANDLVKFVRTSATGPIEKKRLNIVEGHSLPLCSRLSENDSFGRLMEAAEEMRAEFIDHAGDGAGACWTFDVAPYEKLLARLRALEKDVENLSEERRAALKIEGFDRLARAIEVVVGCGRNDRHVFTLEFNKYWDERLKNGAQAPLEKVALSRFGDAL